MGDTTREMNHDELRTFFQQSIEWDSIPGDYTVDEIDRVTLRRFLKLAEKAGRLHTGNDDDDEKIETVLRRLGLIINGKITNGAIMLFGKNPQKYFHNTITRVGRFKTADVIIGDKEIRGNLFNQLDDAENAIKIYINVRWSITEEGMRDTLQRIEKWEYPIVAIREALLNALIHRDYFNNTVQTQIKIFDDFIRFHNPGRLPEGVTVDMLLNEHYTYHRNPKIAEIFQRAGYVERYGSGFERITKALSSEGMPAPEIKNTPLGFTVYLQKDPWSEERLIRMGLNERQINAITYLKEHRRIANSQYQEINNISARTALNDLNDLMEKQVVERRGTSKKNIRYILAPAKVTGKNP